MNTTFELRNQIFSLIYEKSGHHLEQREIEVPEEDGECYLEIIDEYSQYGELLYKSNKNYVLVTSKAFEDDYFYDP